MQTDISIKSYNECQHFNNKYTLYVHLPPNIIAELKPWELVDIKRIGP